MSGKNKNPSSQQVSSKVKSELLLLKRILWKIPCTCKKKKKKVITGNKMLQIGEILQVGDEKYFCDGAKNCLEK